MHGLGRLGKGDGRASWRGSGGVKGTEQVVLFSFGTNTLKGRLHAAACANLRAGCQYMYNKTIKSLPHDRRRLGGNGAWRS